MARRSQNAPGGEAESESEFKGARFAGPYLYLSVFLSGGSILVLEIAAGRVMAPHFGNTIFNWTSMIGIILAALSVGYAVGGRLADRNPSPKLFYGIMILGAGLVALVPPLRLSVLPLLEGGFSLRTGPVVGGLLLFAAPSVVLAALTPFAVRLAARGEGTLGTVTGDLFTWSTVGSIAGTFLTGFVLVPLIGLNAIFLATALALAAAGGGGLYLAKGKTGAKPPLWIFYFVGASLLTGAAATPNPPGKDADVLLFRENMYHTLRITEKVQDGKRVRQLFLDFQPEGAMVVGDDSAQHFEYTRFLSLGPAALPEMRRAFFLGGGAFTMPKVLQLLQPGVEITVAEIDPDVIAAGRRFFRLGQYPKFRLVTGDGRRALRRTEGKFDFIVGDAYRGLRNIPSHLVTREFFEEVRARLTPRGAFFLNLIAFRAGPGAALYASVYRTMKAVFPQVLVFSTDPDAPTVPQNILLFAFREDRPGRIRRFLDKLAAEPRYRFIAAGRVAPPAPRIEGPVLTDDYAPVENLIARGL